MVATAVLVTGLWGCGSDDDTGSAVQRRSYASWTGALSDADTTFPGRPAPQVKIFNNQTVRHVLRLSLGGDEVRVKVSNLFGRRYPNQLDDRLKAAGLTRVGVVNQGISDNRWLNEVSGPSGNSRFERDVLGVSGVTHTIILLGINDIGFSEAAAPTQAVTADQIVASMDAAASKAKARNIDGVIDFDRVMRSATDPLAMNPACDSGDHLHPNDAGYGAMATAIDLARLQ